MKTNTQVAFWRDAFRNAVGEEAFNLFVADLVGLTDYASALQSLTIKNHKALTATPKEAPLLSSDPTDKNVIHPETFKIATTVPSSVKRKRRSKAEMAAFRAGQNHQ